MREIDIGKWKRKSHYEWFGSFANPCYDMTVRTDVTKVLEFCKSRKQKFFATVAYFVSRAADEIEGFRYRILGGKVYEVDCANVCFTVETPDECFVNCRVRNEKDYTRFCGNVQGKIDCIKAAPPVQTLFNDVTIVDDIYLSCVPWLDYLSVTQPVPENNPENNCIPRICWGKYVEEGGRYKMSMSAAVSHALVDGRDISGFFRLIAEYFAEPERFAERGGQDK